MSASIVWYCLSSTSVCIISVAWLCRWPLHYLCIEWCDSVVVWIQWRHCSSSYRADSPIMWSLCSLLSVLFNLFFLFHYIVVIAVILVVTCGQHAVRLRVIHLPARFEPGYSFCVTGRQSRRNICPSVRPSARTYVRPSTNSFFDFNEIWRVGRGDEWYTTVCSMTQSKVKVTSPRKLEIPPFSKAASSAIYHRSWQLTTDL